VRVDEETPVEQHGELWLKREDSWCLDEAGQHGAKVRTCLALGELAQLNGARELVTAGSRHSPQVAIVAEVGLWLSMPTRVFVPAGEETQELAAARELGAEVVQVRPGHNSVIVARARDWAKASHGTAALVPFGMECQEAVDLTSLQLGNMPRHAKRIVVPVGSGMTLAGILQGMTGWVRHPLPVLGVVVGADPTKRLDRWAPWWWQQHVELVPAGVPYSHRIEAEQWLEWHGELPWLDPVYEAKAVPHLRDGDVFWLVGRRGQAS
jgi:1-aminocyclopropane-1-carboxylate deaminase/D-cysteine desulfhydrase-like pyridoxal-dependent ACC family enzyme